MIVHKKVEHFDTPLYLESGRILESYDLAYETYGTLNKDRSNIIVLCHALTGSAHVAGRENNESKAGWWDAIVGDGKTIDATKYFVICVNVLGSCFGSTGPISNDPRTNKPYRLMFPVITVSDMVRAQYLLFKKLGFDKVEAIIGGSLGAMQALCFSVEYPDFAKRIVCLAGTHATSPWAISFNKIAIEGIKNDPEFKNGFYDIEEVKEKGLLGLVLGRMAGHISFLSPDSMNKKFDRNYVDTDGLYELFGRFQVERYLEYNGYSFSKRFDPLCYLYIIKAMNIFDASRNYTSLSESLGYIKAKITLIAFSGDLLFFPEEMEVIRDTLVSLGKEDLVKYYCVESSYGHDAFLVEFDKFEHLIKEALE